MTEQEVAELQSHVASRRWRSVAGIVEPLSRRKLDGALFPVFEPLLAVKDYVIYKTVIQLVGKMRNPPAAAFDAVLNTWQTTWLFDCPQCTDYALKSLLTLDPQNPRIVDEIARCLTVDNYQVHKDCAAALMKIDSPAARRVLEQFESYLPRQYTEKLMVDLLAKIRAHLEATQ
ncbi:MAG: hypothetical protein J5I93_07875 [Pirellulaceae bacterium]|nr:hypothetical protein [Pirellulaceae bacterium]